MFDHKHYVPILKWRQGEQLALRELDAATRAKLTPLVEIPPVSWDHVNERPTKTLDDHLSGTAAAIQRNWGSSPLLVDLPWCHEDRVEDGRLAVESVFEDCRSSDVQVIPVTGLARGHEYQAAVRDIVEQDGLGVCIRVEPDIEGLYTLSEDLESLCAQLRLTKDKCHLLLDFKSVADGPSTAFVLALTALLNVLDDVNDWATLTWAGTAFPENLSAVPADSTQLIRRVEWDVWAAVAKRGGVPRIPTFSDYAISHPDPVDIDPRVIRMSANLRYTTPDAWLILRGRNVRQHGHEQFNALCRALVARVEYEGPAFSWGDDYIKRCADGSDGPGSAMTWRKAGVSHHLALVTRDLSSFPWP